MREKLRKSGISPIGYVPWGTHICQFYQTKKDLLDILIPYFKAGLENNEFCLWVVSEPLETDDAKETLRISIPGIDTYLEKGQIEIIHYTDWFTTEGVFDSKKVFNCRVEKLNRALDIGYDGMRLSGNTSWLKKESWNSFIEFKEQTDKSMGYYKLINLCTYPLERHNAAEIIDVVVNHQFALIKREGKWKSLESAKRKQIENALRESEKRERARSEELAAVLDAVPVAVFIGRDLHTLQITGNRLSYEWLKLPMGANFSKSAPEEERPETFTLFKDGVEIPPEKMPSQMAASGMEINDCELDIVSTDGRIRHVLGNARPLRNEQGEICGSVSAFIDITERKKAEEALKEANDNLENLVKKRTAELETAYKLLKESEKGLAEAQRMANIGNWEWNILTDEAYWSDELYRIFKRSPQEPAPNYAEYMSYVHPEDRDFVADACKEALNGKPYSIDHRIIVAGGEELTIHKKSDIIYDEQSKPILIKGIIQDITERKKAEKALELSEEKYRLLTEQTGQLVYDYYLETDTTDWAGNIEELTGFTSDELKTMKLKFWLSLIHPEDLNRYLENFEKHMESGEAYRMEYRFRNNNEEYIFVEDNGICLRDEKGKVNRILGVIKDITLKKKAEIFLAHFETARKKEIHHRIKNNLQVISSLLDLQSEKFRNRECVQDEEVLKAFRESQDRVTSIALIHEELHEGRGNDTLNFSPYLEKLVKNLFQTYSLGNASTGLNIELEEDIFFDMDVAVPLGIIINELVSNSLKYAFSGKENELIQIKLCREKFPKKCSNITNYILTVSDNGIGIPENFNSENSNSLGLQLVMILVDQLEGELELKRDSGTEFVIRFGVAEKQ
ncbi:MAG: hypothetical protein QG646_4412 [Euryarchaeota archaeon]|nr:hypothetical protein [Euryarchaeota archaeon]